MDSRRRFTEDESKYQITSSTAINLMHYDEDIQDILFKCFSVIDYPGESKYDYWAINIDNHLFLEVSILGKKNNSIVVYKVEEIDDSDVYLDYINAKRTLKWDTDYMTLT